MDMMYQQQEALEIEWISYINATQVMDTRANAKAVQDDEHFANYSAHLSATERDIVVREWWEEKARRESSLAVQVFTQSRMARKMLEEISKMSAVMVKFMVTADRSFQFKDSTWKLPGDSIRSFGFQRIKFTQVNPFGWAPNAPKGPFLVSALQVYHDDGTPIEVDKQEEPISVMSEHSSFASASCFYWEWEANNGLGGWAQKGLLNNEKGCSTTHLSIVAMFLDITAPINEFPSAEEA